MIWLSGCVFIDLGYLGFFIFSNLVFMLGGGDWGILVFLGRSFGGVLINSKFGND